MGLVQLGIVLLGFVQMGVGRSYKVKPNSHTIVQCTKNLKSVHLQTTVRLIKPKSEESSLLLHCICGNVFLEGVSCQTNPQKVIIALNLCSTLMGSAFDVDLTSQID